MTRIAMIALALGLTLSPAAAQDGEGSGDMKEGMDLLSEGTKLLLRGLMKEIEPALGEIEGALEQLEDQLGDLNAYHPPEVLPNGDIIIRRKEPLRPEPEAPGPEIEL